MDYNKIIATWNEFIQENPDAIDLAEFDLLKETAYIKKVGSEWCVFGEGGRKFGCYSSKPAAETRLKQIEMFRHIKSNTPEESSRFHFCICENCNAQIATTKYCENLKCPVCGEYDLLDVVDEEESADKTVGKQHCECLACGSLFWSSKRCDLSTCPVCGEQDDIDELTGVM